MLIPALAYIFLLQVAALEFGVKGSIAKHGEVFIVNGSGNIYAELSLENASRLTLDVEATNVNGVVVLSHNGSLRTLASLKPGSNSVSVLLAPSTYELIVVAWGNGTLRIEARLEGVRSEFSYTGEEYELHILNVTRQTFTGGTFGFDILLVAKKQVDQKITVKSDDCEKTIFIRGKVKMQHVELNCFKVPGMYDVEVSGEGWSHTFRVTVYPGIDFSIVIAAIAATAIFSFAIRGYLRGLSIGQRFVYVAIVLLILAAVVLSVYGEGLANAIAIVSYYFLTLGVINLLFEYRSEKFGAVRGVVSLLAIAYLIHVTPEVLKYVPYADWLTALTALIVGAYVNLRGRS